MKIFGELTGSAKSPSPIDCYAERNPLCWCTFRVYWILPFRKILHYSLLQIPHLRRDNAKYGFRSGHCLLTEHPCKCTTQSYCLLLESEINMCRISLAWRWFVYIVDQPECLSLCTENTIKSQIIWTLNLLWMFQLPFHGRQYFAWPVYKVNTNYYSQKPSVKNKHG